MKKRISYLLFALFILASILVSFVGCNGKTQKAENKISAKDLANTFINMHGVKSFGIIKVTKNKNSDVNNVPLNFSINNVYAEETEKKNYFVKFDENNNSEKVVFYKPKEGSEDIEKAEIIEQDEIKAQITQLYVTGKFTFASFSIISTVIDNRVYYAPSDDYIVLIIDNSSGKVFSAEEIGGFHAYDGYIYRISDNTWYELKVENNSLKLIQVIANKNIIINKIEVDKWGTVFIENDVINERVDNRIFYTPSTDLSYHLSKDKTMFLLESGYYSLFGEIKYISKLDEYGNKTSLEDNPYYEFNVFLVNGYMFYGYLFLIKGNKVIYSYYDSIKIYEIDNSSNEPDNNKTKIRHIHDEYAENSFHYKDNYIFYFYDNTLKYIDLDNCKEENTLLTNVVELEKDINDKLIVTTETLSSTNKYEVIINQTNNSPELIPYSEKEYQSIIITIQPLN